ncbi:MAG: hypothetical protein MJZ57_07855 [Bacteroidales bacterium]|nr:hypothetical protein [Bacteroidales bacterium]
MMNSKSVLLVGLWLLTCIITRAQSDCGTITDYDGNVYPTVQLGEQCWMAQNLRVKHFADGTPLLLGTETQDSSRCYYNPADISDAHGLLYTWFTALHGEKPSEAVPSGLRGVCPAGWHLPSNFEWMGLEDFLGYKDEYRCGTDVNQVAKAMASQSEWVKDEYSTAGECCIVEHLSENNNSGMNILPAGSFWMGSYSGSGYNTGFWTASDGSDVTSPIHYLVSTNATVEINCTPKDAAYSVRCIKD